MAGPGWLGLGLADSAGWLHRGFSRLALLAGWLCRGLQMSLERESVIATGFL
ncbi:hypothetical protein [Corynebacterium jeikeium]|uniref:hypothetical protein n=1 Tax=Corynebacterium jeikeium TaxID=38289 RepID=UPI0001B71630|nr:hypothetical protein [Corynebacterium jeikeium]EEW16136.1 hypothetical protein HMPREF0297_1477 [Corynebacterium jeikeium ATCC 43734]